MQMLFGDQFAEMARKMTAPRSGELWEYLVSRWEGVAARVAEKGVFKQGALALWSMTPMVVEAAVIWRLTGRADAKEYAVARLQELVQHYQKPDGGSRDKSWQPFVHSHGESALAAHILGEALPAALEAALLHLARTEFIGENDFYHALTGYGAGGNVPLARHINASLVALALGERCGYPDWQRVVDNTCDNVRQYLRRGCDELGFPYEGTGYGAQVMQMLFLFCLVLRQVKWHDNLLQSEPLLKLIPSAYQQMMFPDGSYCATTNDSGHRAPVSLWWFLLAAKAWDRPDYIGAWENYSGPNHPVRPWGDTWPAWTKLAQQEERMVEHVDKTLLLTFILWEPEAAKRTIEESPLPTAVCGTGTGTATFRTSWSREAVFATFLGGGRSTASLTHAHADCGHFNLIVGGEYLAVDTGRYNTNADQHSVMLVDGKNYKPSSAPGAGMAIDLTWGHLRSFQRHALLDYCVADGTNTRGARWAFRHFLFVRGGNDSAYVVLLDNINVDDGKEAHTYWWQMQCATTARLELTGTNTATLYGKEARLDCAFFQKPEPPVATMPHKLTLQQDVKEWVWPYGYEQNTAAFERTGESITSVRRPRLLALQETLTGMLLSVLSPRRSGEASREVRQIAVQNGIGIEVIGAEFDDTILVAPDHRLVLAAGVKCFSEFVVIRRDKEGRIVDRWSESGEPIMEFF